jgi:hypothetical protein
MRLAPESATGGYPHGLFAEPTAFEVCAVRYAVPGITNGLRLPPGDAGQRSVVTSRRISGMIRHDVAGMSRH